MKLALKIAAGIVLGFGVLWAAQVGFTALFLSGVSSAMSEMFQRKQANVPYTRAEPASSVSAGQFQIPLPPVQVAITAPRSPKRIIGYKEKWVSGRPLDKCLGANKELNADVLRCRNGYMKKIPIYSE